MTTPHVQSFVLISMLRGQPKTPPSGDDLAVLDYHLKHIVTRSTNFPIERGTMYEEIRPVVRVLSLATIQQRYFLGYSVKHTWME